MQDNIEAQISRCQVEILRIECGFDENFPLGKPVSAYEAGVAINKEANNLVKLFESVHKEEIIKTRLNLKTTTFLIRTDKCDSESNQIFVIKTLEDFVENCSKTYRLFDFESLFNEGFNEQWENFNRIAVRMMEAFEQDAQLKRALAAQSKFFSESVKRLKKLYEYRIVHHPIFSSSWITVFKCPEYVMELLGSSGGIALDAIKYTAGENWETNFKPILHDYIYNQIRGKNPVSLLKFLTTAKAAKGENLSKEVADEFFPELCDLKQTAERYTLLINEKEALEIRLSEIKSKTCKLS